MPDETLLERVQRLDWRLTDQRRAVARALSGDDGHLTAKQVHRAARTHHADLSVATVYNTLNELVGLGEVVEVTGHGGPTRYDPNVAGPHHHLLCDHCGLMVDVHPDRVPSPADGDAHGFRVDEVEVTFRGRCADCRRGG